MPVIYTETYRGYLLVFKMDKTTKRFYFTVTKEDTLLIEGNIISLLIGLKMVKRCVDIYEDEKKEYIQY